MWFHRQIISCFLTIAYRQQIHLTCQYIPLWSLALLPPSLQRYYVFGWCDFVLWKIGGLTERHLYNRCFKCLGPFFTFEITIRPQHLLITHGPYAWVRHPSYTGVYLTLTGATSVLGSPGTWISVCGIRSMLGVMIIGVWLMKCAFAFRGMCVRLRAEDEVLRATFGAEWEAYASRVPFKFLPGVV